MSVENHPRISCIIATYNRRDDLEELIPSILDQEYDPIEIIVVSSATDDTAELFEDGGRFDEEGVQYHEYTERMGVPEARNIGFSKAEGDIYISIDDDACLLGDGAFDRVVDIFDDNPDVGAVAFQSVDYDTHEVNRDEIPDPPEFQLTADQAYRTSHFVGVGHAIRAEVIETVGTYPSDFVYGFEEMDLSMRILDAGYDIWYTPNIRVAHKKSPAGRMDAEEIQKRLVENRIKLSVRNLPWRYVALTSVIWSCYALVLTRDLPVLRSIYEDIADQKASLIEQRDPIGKSAIKRMKQRRTLLFGWWMGPHPGRFVGENGSLERLLWEN